MKSKFYYYISLCLTSTYLFSQTTFTKADSMRGSDNQYRKNWDVLHYTLTITPDFESKTIKGSNIIRFKNKAQNNAGILQIDLQEPMQLDSVFFHKALINKIKRIGNYYLIDVSKEKIAIEDSIQLYFSGKARETINAPWDGGWVFKKDAQNRPWMSVACEGIGASVWFPCKDFLGDEPDQGAIIQVHTNPKGIAVSNGKLNAKKTLGNVYTWQVKNPINSYNIIPYIGNYTHFSDAYKGLNGDLSLDYWVLDYNLEKAKKQFSQVPKMLAAFEYWFGAYPFYTDGYKLVESPYLGMEHQSAIAYGNGYQNGYLGDDLSGTGVGMAWDFIIIHESGHEWFGNNISVKDVADMWIHEAFTTYSEVLFTEFTQGKDAANQYIIGQRNLIQNDKPIIGKYGVNNAGSADMYAKGGNMIHTLRQLIRDDAKFRALLQGINRDFYHQTVSSEQIEKYIMQQTNLSLETFFEQYLRTTRIPVLEIRKGKNKLSYRWNNVVPGFQMKVQSTDGQFITPSEVWKSIPMKALELEHFSIAKNYYIYCRNLE